jgi:hypothetical protein
MFERDVARFVSTPVAFEIIRSNIKEHKAAGLTVEPAIKFLLRNPVVAGHVVTKILGLESSRLVSPTMMPLLYSNLVADCAVWMFVFMIEAMQLPLGKLTGSGLGL